MSKLSTEQRISRASEIIHECICDEKMSVTKIEKLADAALDILYPKKPKKDYEPGYYTFKVK